MKRFLLTGFIFISLAGWCQKNKKPNVLSYYAVTNSIDGQPLINERNLLRFYPIFALRDSIKSVKVTLYYGDDVFIEEAIKFHNGLYWEIKLPEFDLGDAIQRYEVEARLRYFIDVKSQLLEYKDQLLKKKLELINSLEKHAIDAKAISKAFDDAKAQIDIAYSHSVNTVNDLQQLESVVSTMQFASLKILYDTIYNRLAKRNILSEAELEVIDRKIMDLSDAASSIKADFESVKLKYESSLDNLFREYKNPGNLLVNTVLPKINRDYEPIRNSDKEQKDIAKYITSQEFLVDSLKESLARKLTDKNFTGSGIQASDIVFEKDYKIARILYRNYRMENRTLVALDPAERLSVFRLRYIPFPIIGNKLKGPGVEGVPIVFEAAITFGNQIISSNEFALPELSIRRLGVGVAFTPELFSSNAKILALLVSYDFNAYASIGVGANFGTLSEKSPDPYISFGINQRAFQALISGIGNIFK